MTFFGNFLLICLVIVRLIPEAITLVIVSGISIVNREKFVARDPFWMLAAITGGLNFLIYLFSHRMFLLTWDIGETITQIRELEFLYQNIPYFIKSIIICTVFSVTSGGGISLY